MAKSYKGSLSLEWYNKQKSILLQSENSNKSPSDKPAPMINWVNKDDALFYEIKDDEGKGIHPNWVDRNDIRIKEVRPFVFKKGFIGIQINKNGTLPEFNKEWSLKEIKNDDESIENMLIMGDNLLSLKALSKVFANKPDIERIKCIYIDPPYNTESSFELYDDNLEHSEWLSMMRDRLVLLHTLLREDGFIVVQIDEKEQAYLKVLMDEIFGRDNFVNQVIVKTKPSAGASGGGEDRKFKKNVEYLLFYSKTQNFDFSFSHEKEFRDLFELITEMKDENKSWKYTNILLGKGELAETITIKDGQGKDIIVRRFKNIKRTTINQLLKDKPKLSPDDLEFNERKLYFDNFDLIFSDTNSQSSIRTRVIDAVGSLSENELLEVEYIPGTGKDKGNSVKHYYISNSIRRVIWLKDSAIKDDVANTILKADVLSTLWLGLNWNNVTKEGNVQFPSGKKPEALIEKILETTTEEGDLVLDSFAGSGTTASVAHKMNRKWIAIEIGKHAETKIIPRLQAVILGENQSGITNNTWNGGGSFKYYKLGQSILTHDSAGNIDFNWSLGRNFIEQSLLLSYDYVLDSNINLQKDQLFQSIERQPIIGIQKVGTKKRVAVFSLNEPNGMFGLMSYEEIQSIYKVIKAELSPEYINIFTNRGVEIASDSKPDDLEIIKVPHAIFAELEK